MEFFNWFLNPIKNQYADFEGRATRQQFWMYVLVYIVIFIPLYIIANMIGLGMLVQLASLAVLVPSLAIGARRLHDTGLSGWFQLINFVPFIGWIIMIVLFARKGDAAENIYGANPANPTATSDPAAAAQVPPAPAAEPAPAAPAAPAATAAASPETATEPSAETPTERV